MPERPKMTLTNGDNDERGAESLEMSRWQGGIDADLEAIRREVSERDQRYSERADAQNRAVDAALAAQKEAVSAALAASDKAVSKAELTAEKWREQANEWRGAMSDRDRELPSRREVDQVTTALSDRLAKVEGDVAQFIATTSGRAAGIGASLTFAQGVILLALAVAGFYLANH